MSGRVILVAAIGRASGSAATAAALACAGSEPDRPGLLIDVGGRPPRPTLLASAGARELEERLAVHLPRLRAASRGQICRLSVAGDPLDVESLRAALPTVRDSIAVVHLPPECFREVLEAPDLETTGVLIRADLDSDRALAGLVVKDLVDRGLPVKVLKRPLAWVAARRALFGVLPPDAAGGLPESLSNAFTLHQIPVEHTCYGGLDDAEIDPEGAAEQQRRDHARPGRRRGLRGHPQRQAGR